MSMFPEGYFYILSRKHGFALDVYDGQTKEDANVIVWPQKFSDSENQLWSYTGNRLENKKSGHVLDISSSAFRKDKTIVQKKRKPNKQAQEWIYDQGFICCKEYPSLVLDIRGDSIKGGAQVLLYKRKETDNLNQQWQFEPYHQFEGAMKMVEETLPLHKKEGFGLPRLGYAAEVGVPPELTKLPENNNIAGVGKNAYATPTTDSNPPPQPHNKPGQTNQYGSFYGYPTQTAPPPPQPVQAPSNAYPPPPSNYSQSPTANAYPPPPSNYSQSPTGNAYPPQPIQLPNSPSLSGGGYPVPPSAAGNYPQSNNNNSGYSSSEAYSSPPSYQQPGTGFPQSSNSSSYPLVGSPPPNNGGYPLVGSPPQLNPNNPSYPPNNTYPNAYPPPSGNQSSSMYPPPPPPNGGGGFYAPGMSQQPNRQDQYGSYPYPQ